MKLSDDNLWHEVREQAAKTGWNDRDLLLDTATEALCKRHRIKSDAERENIAGRLGKLWADRMAVMGAN